MVFAVALFVISLICSIAGFIFRKALGAVFKLIPIIAVFIVGMCFVRGVPVYIKVNEYKELCETNIEEIKQDAEKYQEYVKKAKELNDWVSSYKVKIEEHPAFTFCKSTIEEFELLEIK